MKNIIIDYSNLNDKLLNLLVEKFPEGYGYDDIIHFQNHKGETISAVEIKTNDTVYLVKISRKLEKTMEDFIDEEKDDTDDFDNKMMEDDYDF